jgi:hypothetical protein
MASSALDRKKSKSGEFHSENRSSPLRVLKSGRPKYVAGTQFYVPSVPSKPWHSVGSISRPRETESSKNTLIY